MQPGFFDQEDRLAKLEKIGDPLPRLDSIVDWQAFRPLLKVIHQKQRKSNAGRKPHDVALMFKMLVLQALYNLSDDQTEFQVRDRLSFQRFLGLSPEDTVPDAKTLWLFREQLTRHGLIDKLFQRFDEQLWASGLMPKGGQIVDASLVRAEFTARAAAGAAGTSRSRRPTIGARRCEPESNISSAISAHVKATSWCAPRARSGQR